MVEVEDVTKAALALRAHSDQALEILLAKRDLAIKAEPSLADDLGLDPKYAEPTMGVQELQALGRRIVARWNKELYGVVCAGGTAFGKDRAALINALNLGEAAVIGAVASALLSLGVVAALAAALAPILVRRFIWPAKEELCTAWGEAIKG